MTRAPARPGYRHVRRAAITVAAVALVAGCASSTTPAPTAPTSGSPTSGAATTSSARAITVDVKNFAFAPQHLTIPIGTRVTWRFEDAAQHTVTAANGAFASPPLNDDHTYSFTFHQAGVYRYICSIHTYMTATITVK